MMPRTKAATQITAVTVGTSATPLLAANHYRQHALLVNHGETTVYVGTSAAVTTANGLPLEPGQTLEDTLGDDAWWSVVASGTGDMRVLEVAT